MIAGDWLRELATELRRQGVGPELARQVVAEAESHLRDSGEPPPRVFGTPAAYAAEIASSVAGPAPEPRRAPSGQTRLDARGITKRYRRRTVLDGVDLRVRAGEVAAVVGANGSGKSTLLAICAGLISPDAGQVSVRGSLGYSPQAGGTADYLLPEEQFVLIGAGRELDRAASRRAGRAHAAALDWAPVPRVQARHLSGGTRQKLNLVLAGIGDPDVLLLDEPYQGFDRGSYLDFWHQIWRWRDAGKAIVVVTHLLSHLDRVDILLDLSPATREASA